MFVLVKTKSSIKLYKHFRETNYSRFWTFSFPNLRQAASSGAPNASLWAKKLHLTKETARNFCAIFAITRLQHWRDEFLKPIGYLKADRLFHSRRGRTHKKPKSKWLELVYPFESSSLGTVIIILVIPMGIQKIT